MSKNIQVILLEDVNGLGVSGNIVEVDQNQAKELFESGSAAKADSPAEGPSQGLDLDDTDLYVTALDPETVSEAINQQHSLKLKPDEVAIVDHEAVVTLPLGKKATIRLVLAEDEEA